MDNGDFKSEEKLTLSLKKGEPKAYEQVYRDSFPTIKTLVQLNSGCEDHVFDLLQDAIIALYQKLQDPSFVLTCKVSTFIYAICRNNWLKYLRNRKIKTEIFDVIKFDRIPDTLPDEEQTQKLEQLQKAFDRLDVKCQQILIKFYYYSQSLDEITQSLQLPNINAVKVKKCRCIQKLKEDLSKELCRHLK